MIELCMRYFCMALEASVVILLVLAARPFFKKFSNRITCLLWAVVMLRLLCPVTISNPFANKTGENTKQEEAAFFSEKKTTMGYMADDALNPIPNEDNGNFKRSLNESDNVNWTENMNADSDSKSTLAEAAYVNAKLISDSSNYSMKESEYAKNESGYSVTDSEFSMNASELSVNDSTFPAKDSEHSVKECLSEKTKDEQGETKSWFGELAGQVSEKISQTMAKGRAWKQTDFGMIITNILGITWLLGMIGFLAVGVIKYSKIVKKLGEAVPFGKWGKYKVKQSDIAGVPMSFGIIHPRIYVPLSFSDEKEDELPVAQQKMILIHESMHLKHLDPLWKLIAYIALSVHWWNPLVWLSIRCMNQDLEMACDENVIKQLGKENRQEYASTLLQFATNRSGISLTAAFGESHAERRIKNVLRYKAIPLWLTVTLGGLVLSLGGCLATVGGNLYSGVQTVSDNDAMNTSVSDNDAMNTSVSDNDALNTSVSDNDAMNTSLSDNNARKPSVLNDEVEENSVSEQNALSVQVSWPVEINDRHFPDAIFREYISNHFDADHDDFLTEGEVKGVTDIKCSDMNIESLIGIEYFPELTKLDCSNNLLKDLDISKNTKLKYLICEHNLLEKLDIRNCPELIRALSMHIEYENVYGIEEVAGFIEADYNLYENILPNLENLDISFLFDRVHKDNWKDIYTTILEKWTYENWSKCGLIYFDEDEIPELVVMGEGMYKIYTIKNEKVYEINLSVFEDIFYWEGNNILNLKYYDDNSNFMIGNDGFERIHTSTIKSDYDRENDIYVPKYFIDNQAVTMNEYNDYLEKIIPFKERKYLEDWLCADRRVMLRYLKGEVYKDYKEAYEQYLRNELNRDSEYKGFALIERDEDAPLLLCVDEDSLKCVVYQDGMLSDQYEIYNLLGEDWVYDGSGMIEYYLYKPLDKDLAVQNYIRTIRYQMKDGSTTLQYGLSYESVEGDGDNAAKVKHFEINDCEVTEEEYMDFINSTKGYEKHRILPFGDPNAEIEYLSAEEMIEILK